MSSVAQVLSLALYRYLKAASVTQFSSILNAAQGSRVCRPFVAAQRQCWRFDGLLGVVGVEGLDKSANESTKSIGESTLGSGEVTSSVYRTPVSCPLWSTEQSQLDQQLRFLPTFGLLSGSIREQEIGLIILLSRAYQ
jgi:hypothetical protein